ncbi:hypothetical protein DICVIV_11161 [Dictyocaulus viviparus]|uniref:Uncharacterized protein n=1 Tax=Dictyocaulus viviparus TaxID=29172 RepID=A0A0D8XKI2_DICVI|nr:hypothetical protein DICVIV_11161 [Dictyocaulus viviparus]
MLTISYITGKKLSIDRDAEARPMKTKPGICSTDTCSSLSAINRNRSINIKLGIGYVELKNVHENKELPHGMSNHIEHNVDGDPLAEYRREEERLKNTNSVLEEMPRSHWSDDFGALQKYH